MFNKHDITRNECMLYGLLSRNGYGMVGTDGGSSNAMTKLKISSILWMR